MPRRKILSIPLALALLSLMFGTLFHIQHWPYGFEIKLSSLLIIGMLYVLRYFFKNFKTLKDTTKVVMVITWVLLTVFVMFKMTDFVYLRIVLELSGLLWLVLEIRDLIKRKPIHERLNILQWLGMSIVLTHFLFQLQHWPCAGFTFALYVFCAHLLLAIGFLLDSKRRNNPSRQDS